jgi:DNA invertase Pin-like site-specific DNA recombinase
MANIGFARVSTIEQDLTVQLKLLSECGCERIFSGKQSGSSSENDKKLVELINYIRQGDIAIVTKIDRLGRSLKAILRTIDAIHEKGATLKSLDGAIDTSNNSPIAKATVALLSTFAQLERDLIVDRTSEGRQQAMADGVQFGRPPRLSEVEKIAVVKKYKGGKTMETLAREYSVSRMTISRIVRE